MVDSGNYSVNLIRRSSNALLDYFNAHDITTNRLVWQPIVVLAQPLRLHWYKHSIEFPLNCFIFPVKDYSYTWPFLVDKAKVSSYCSDERYAFGIHAQLSDKVEYAQDDDVYICYLQNYIEESLTVYIMESMIGKLYRLPDEAIDEAVHKVYNLFKKHWPDYRFKMTPHGSCYNGLSFSNLSLNICITMDDPDLFRLENRPESVNDYGEPHCQKSVQGLFDKEVSKFKFYEDINSVQLKFRMEANVGRVPAVEYNFNKKIFVKSNDLINEYQKLDPRVKPFLAALKVLCRGRNIFTSQIDSGMRFYGFTLQAIAYLQSLDPPVLPNLQHVNEYNMHDDCHISDCASKKCYWDTVLNKFTRVGIAARYHSCVKHNSKENKTTYHVKQDPKTRCPYWNSSNTASVGALFIDFLFYYGYIFDYKRDAVSVKFGGHIPRKDSWKTHAIAIEDPFMADTNVADNVSGKRIIDLYKGSFTVLYSNIWFNTLTKKVSSISSYDSIHGIGGNKDAYTHFMYLHKVNRSKTFVLIDLPKIADEAEDCYCDRIKDLFSPYGTVDEIVRLDHTTLQVYFTGSVSNIKEIVLPTSFCVEGSMVHLVELYNYDVTNPTQVKKKNPASAV